MSTAEQTLSPRIISAIRACFPRYPNRRAVVLPALHLVHEQLGCVSPQAVVEIAKLLELAPAEVQDTLSFYGFFKQHEPQGKIRAWVCRSLSCAACGSEELLEYFAGQLGIRPGETTPDGLITLEFAECLGACDCAPAMLAGETLHTKLTKEKIDEFIRTTREEERVEQEEPNAATTNGDSEKCKIKSEP